jgi:hypothetical protein
MVAASSTLKMESWSLFHRRSKIKKLMDSVSDVGMAMASSAGDADLHGSTNRVLHAQKLALFY